MGPIGQHQHILETLKKNSTVAIEEDYVHWEENDRHRECAKLLLIDQADYSTQHIFFDDSAAPNEDCIVDVRDALTGEILSYKKANGRYIV